ncbi:HNH endonuclease [Streptomyces massasporeus]
MAVSKRLRYEILRRDNHACRYCGATAPHVKLNVDHVIPQSLGGSNKPTNLVASCADCNAGKTSSMPNAMVVSDVDQEAFRRAAQLKREPEKHHNAIALHLYMVWIWAYEKTGRYPTEEQQQWFMEETYRTLACGYSGHVDLTEPAYRAGLHNALDLQSYITLPSDGASAADERFLATVNAIEAWASAWNGATEVRDPYVYETKEAIAAIHRLLDSGCAPADATCAALRAGQGLSVDVERFVAPASMDAKEGVN